MNWLTALGLCVAGLVAIIVEFFVPAAGIIGVLGFASMVGGVVVAYSEYGAAVGSGFLIGVVVITPIVMAYYFKRFPKSFVGKWLILKKIPGLDDKDRRAGADISADDGSEGSLERTSNRRDLLGKRGEAVSILRPSGTVRIDGRKYSVVTGGEFIETGETVVVTRVEGNRINVRREA